MNRFLIEQTKARIREIEILLADENSLGKKLSTGSWWLPLARAVKEKELNKLKNELREYGEEAEGGEICHLSEVQTWLPDEKHKGESHSGNMSEDERERGSVCPEDLPEFLR